MLTLSLHYLSNSINVATFRRGTVSFIVNEILFVYTKFYIALLNLMYLTDTSIFKLIAILTQGILEFFSKAKVEIK